MSLLFMKHRGKEGKCISVYGEGSSGDVNGGGNDPDDKEPVDLPLDDDLNTLN